MGHPGGLLVKEPFQSHDPPAHASPNDLVTHPIASGIARTTDALRPKRVRFFIRKLRLPIRSSDRVVDIGSGGDPHPRADVIVDRYIGASYHRTAGFRRSAPAVVADISHLPFRNGAFGFSVCAHVLEHLDDPAVAAVELSRISKAGYVETPSRIHETLFPMGWHKWLVSRIDDHLRFEAKETAFLDDDLGTFFRTRWGLDRSMMRFIWDHTDDLYIQHVWKDRLDVEVLGHAKDFLVPDGQAPLEGMGDAPKSSGMKRLLYTAASRLRYRRGPHT